MKNKLKILSIILSLIVLTTVIVYAKSDEAGGSDDPLVTKSYVDEKISQILELINENIGNSENNNTNDNSANDSVDDNKDDSADNTTDNSDDNMLHNTSYTPVLVEVGQSIFGGEGTELILRSGKGLAIVPTAEGISNITKSKDVKNNESILKNELLIIPRKDGRGIKVTEKAWFLVRGEYEIK